MLEILGAVCGAFILFTFCLSILTGTIALFCRTSPSKNDAPFNEKDEKIRRKWLFSFKLMFFVVMISIGWQFILKAVADSSAEAVGKAVANLLPYAVISLILPYYCAYRYRGTKYMFMFIINMAISAFLNLKATVLCYFLSFYLVFESIVSRSLIPIVYSIFLFLAVVAMIVIKVYYAANCISLYRLNKRNRKKMEQAAIADSNPAAF